MEVLTVGNNNTLDPFMHQPEPGVADMVLTNPHKQPNIINAPPPLTEDEVAALQKKGRLCYRPIVQIIDDVKVMTTSDNQHYIVTNAGGTIARPGGKVRIKKKDRIKARRTLAAAQLKMLQDEVV